MRSLKLRLLMFALATLAWGSDTARADWWPYTETVYMAPASMALALPTAYVVPSSYVVPTSSVVPTVYATAYYTETAAWTPTSYVETAYVPTTYYYREQVARRGLFGRRREYIVPTTIYYPTTTVIPTTARYYAPTTLEYPLVSEVRYQSVASSCGTCDNSVVVASAPAPRAERRAAIPADEPSALQNEESPRRSSVESDDFDSNSTTSSKVQPPPNQEPADLSPIKKADPTESRQKAEPQRAQPDQISPPPSPAAQPSNAGEMRSSAQPKQNAPKNAQGKEAAGSQKQEELPPPEPATEPKTQDLPNPNTLGLPPIAPSEAGDLPGDNKTSAPKSRQSLKPVLEMPRPNGLTVLRGRVRSSANAEPEEDVQITVSHRNNAFEDRTARTNDLGKFAMRIPDGDWTVKVTMPSGRVYPVYRITVSGGVIVDDQGRDIPGLVIDR